MASGMLASQTMEHAEVMTLISGRDGVLVFSSLLVWLVVDGANLLVLSRTQTQREMEDNELHIPSYTSLLMELCDQTVHTLMIIVK